MVTRRRPLIFVDSNVLIEAVFIPRHPAAAVAILAASKQVDLVTCELVVQDVEDEIIERCRAANDLKVIETWHKLRQETRLRVDKDPPEEVVKQTYENFMGVMRHEADIPVIASAILISPTLILSGNVEHFNEAVSERCGIPIMTCREFFDNLLRSKLSFARTAQ